MTRIADVEPHGPLHQVLPGLHLVQGSMRFGPARFSRNMAVVQRGERLVLVNSVRLDEAGLARLDSLGTVTDVVRLAGVHGRDDPFYQQRYGATVWCMQGQRYHTGIDHTKGETYFTADRVVAGEALEALPDARLFHFDTVPPESALWLPDHGGTLIPGDALHHWHPPAAHFNWVARIVFGLMGFIGPHKLGKGWLDQSKPDPARLEAVLELGWENLLPAHGSPVLGGAAERYRPAVAAYAARYRS